MGISVSGQTAATSLGQSAQLESPLVITHSETSDTQSLATIMVVDDEEAIRSFLTRFLTRVGYTVTAADSGENAIELWKTMTSPPQLLIADLTMPGMGGKAFAARLKAMQPDLKVLFISGSGFDIMKEALAEVRDSRHLFKPFRVDQLIATVEAVLAEL